MGAWKYQIFSRVEHDISLVRSRTREISCSTFETNLVFPRTHVLFSMYLIVCMNYAKDVRMQVPKMAHNSVPIREVHI
jgi:hypothetical protein